MNDVLRSNQEIVETKVNERVNEKGSKRGRSNQEIVETKSLDALAHSAHA